MLIRITLAIAAALITGCAKPFYIVDKSGDLASVTYIRRDVNHFILEETGEVIPPQDVNKVFGAKISTELQETFSTTIYFYNSIDCSNAPAVMGSINPKKQNKASVTKQVRAGVPLVNSYRTQFKTCYRECYKFFYTSSAFIPEANAQYTVEIEPINGVIVNKIENGKKIKQKVETNLSESCKY